LSANSDLYRMTPLEVGAGQILGRGHLAAERTPSTSGPRAALEAAILPALEHPPCLVSFSGGRDSSAILAVTTQLARRHGFADPLPISYRFAGAPSTEESEWQELLVRHLGLVEWERLSIGAEFDLVGPLAAGLLRRHGLVYPPHAHWSVALFDAAAGGSLLTGQGGDELFGPRRARRPALYVWNRKAPWRSATRLVLEQAPAPVRRRLHRRRFHSPTNSFRLRWLRPPARDAVIDRWADWLAEEPLTYRRYLRWCTGWRGREIAFATLDALAAESNVRLLHPLLDPGFVATLATFGWRGPRDRKDAMQRLFADVLPPAALSRTDKATFGGALFSEHSRSFVKEWTGDGVDDNLVDADVLRSIWSEAEPSHGTHVLLQSAWLSTQLQ
jgi:asparagine synthetase B (glutamine-hydrolysing)